MASTRSLVFCDSFDHYDTLTQKYSGGSGGIDLSGTLSRTGIGCLVLSGPIGPTVSVPPVRGATTGYMVGTAFYQVGTEDSVSAGVVLFYDVDPGGGGDITNLFRVGVNASLGLTCIDVTAAPVAISAPNIVVANAYNIIEVKCFFVAAGGGFAFVHLNGHLVTWPTGGLTGLTTLDPSRSSTGGECNNIQLGGPGAPAGGRHDDFTVYTSTATDDSDFLGAVKIYALVPQANGTPLNWVPASGTNFSEVNQIPPPGTATASVSSAVVGDVDQYVYNPGATPVPPGLIVFGAQHSLLTKVTSGSATVASSVGGVVAGGIGIGASDHFAPIVPYDNNPATSAPWSLLDFPGTQIGPKHTA